MKPHRIVLDVREGLAPCGVSLATHYVRARDTFVAYAREPLPTTHVYSCKPFVMCVCDLACACEVHS